jgi:hypothetical protein
MKINLLQGTLNISYKSNNNDNFTWLQVNKNKDGNNNTVFKIDGNG